MSTKGEAVQGSNNTTVDLTVICTCKWVCKSVLILRGFSNVKLGANENCIFISLGLAVGLRRTHRIGEVLSSGHGA